MEPSEIASDAGTWIYPIVVGVDLHPLSERALQEAFCVAVTRPGAAIHVVHVIELSVGASGAAAIARTESLLEAVPQHLRDHVSGVATRCPEARGLTLTLHCRLGSPAEAIVQLAVDVNADMIVVATHGRQGLRKLALGSVASRLVATAPCPVLVARPRDYTGLARSPEVEPVCPDCARVRAETGDVTLWCEAHGRDRPGPHAVAYDEVYRPGRDNTGGLLVG